MAEILTGVAAVPTPIYKLKEIYMNVDTKYVSIILDNNGARTKFEFHDAQAVTIMRTLNTANMAAVSMITRMFNFLINQGLLAGTISGVPD